MRGSVKLQNKQNTRMKKSGELAESSAEGDCATNSQAQGPVSDEALESSTFQSDTDEAIPQMF